MKVYIGLDVHSKNTSFVCQNESGEMISRGQVSTNDSGLRKMLSSLKVPQGTVIGLEAGSSMYLVCKILVGAGMEPMVIDAAEVRAKIHRGGQKSDYRDAFEICQGIRQGIYSSIVYVPDEGVLALRRILSRRRHFVAIATSQVNAVKYLLRSAGLGARKLVTDAAWKKLLAQKLATVNSSHLELHHRMWRQAVEAIAELEAELAQALEPFERELTLLTSVPGVGQITAASFIAAVGDIKRFPSARRLASYIGIVPSTYDSGERQRHGRITRNGPSYLRSVLCQCAHHAARGNNPFNPWWRRICARSGYCKAVVAVAHRLARVLYAVWRDEREFEEDRLGVQLIEQVSRTKKVYCLRRSA